MKNRYLFKAKRLDNGQWVEGYYIHDGVTGKSFIHQKDCELNESDKVGEEGCLRIFAFEIDPSTICQYTGLTDKNGNKIWENDIAKLILLDGEIRYFKVSFKSVNRNVVNHPDFAGKTSKVEITGIVFEWKGYDLFPCIDTYEKPDYKEMEVAGNIFDSPQEINEAKK